MQTRSLKTVDDLLAELEAVEKEYPGGSERSVQIRQQIQVLTGEQTMTGSWMTEFWVRHKLYDYFGWSVPLV